MLFNSFKWFLQCFILLFGHFGCHEITSFCTYQKLIEKQETKKTINPAEYWIWPVSNATTHFNEGRIKKERSYNKGK